MPMAITSSPSGRLAAATLTVRAPRPCRRRRPGPPGSTCRPRSASSADALQLAAGRGRTHGRRRCPACCSATTPGDAALGVLPDGRPELAVAIPGTHEPWGVLLIVGETRGSLTAIAMSRSPGSRPTASAPIVSGAQHADEVAHLLHRADALRRVASDIGSRLDLDQILAGLVDHAMVLFEADRAAVFLQRRTGRPWPR